MKAKKQRESLTPGQVAVRWGVDRTRVHALIRCGKLAAFTVPSAGRFGQALRVPLAAVLAAEEEWQVLPAKAKPKPPPKVEGYQLSHLRLPAGQCPGGGLG